MSFAQDAENGISILNVRDSDEYLLTPYVYVVEDTQKTKDVYKAIASYTSGGARSLENYEFSPVKDVGYWMFFRAKNLSSLRSKWVLDFGRNMNGSIGISDVVLFYSSHNFEDYLIADGRYVKNKRQVQGQTANAVPIELKYDDVETFALYVEPMQGFPFHLQPRLVDAFVQQAQSDDLIYKEWVASLLVLALVVIAASTFARKGDNTYLLLSIYTGLFLLNASSTDQILPYGNNTGAVYFDIVFVVQLIFGLLLTLKLLSPYNYKASAQWMSSVFASIFTLLLISATGSVNYTLNHYFALLLFTVAAFAVPAYLTGCALLSKSKDVSLSDKLGYAVAWALPALLNGWMTFGGSQSGRVALCFMAAHIVLVNLYSFNMVRHKLRLAQKRESQRQMKSEAEEEIRKAYEIVSRNSASDADQRDKDLLIDIKKHETQMLQEANETNESKLKLMAMVSHEIRTPMTGIMGLINLLSTTHLNDKQREYIDTMHQTGKSLLQMLNDVLDLSKAESGKMELEVISFNVRDVMRSVVTISEPNARNKKLEMISEIDPDIPQVLLGDPSRLRQIMMNIVNNAIKFTDSGYIKLAVKIQETKDNICDLMFTIEDTGIGIPDNMREVLFKPYSQGGGSVSRKYGGTGLGLYICHHLVNAMGGNIDFKRSDRGGTVFFFNIPCEVPKVEQQVAAHGQPDLQASAVPTAGGDKDAVNILVVDDHEANRNIIAALLRKNNWKIVEAGSAHEAVNEINKAHFDAVFMDLEMPEFNGLHATGMIRKIPDRAKANTPIIAMTAHSDKTVIAQCIQAGMNGYVSKPVDIEKMEQIINTLVSRKRGTVVHSAEYGVGASAAKPDDSGSENSQGQSENLSLDELGDLINETVFGSLLSIEKTQLNKLLNELFTSLDQQVAALGKAVSTKNMHDIQAQAHGIKGVASNYGLEALSNSAASIEKLAKDSAEMEVIIKRANNIPDLYKRTKSEVSTKLR